MKKTRPQRILVSWVGHGDLFGLGKDNASLHKFITKTINVKSKNFDWTESIRDGAIKVALSQQAFDKAYLFWAYSDQMLIKDFETYLGNNAEVLPSPTIPTDYRQIYITTEKNLDAIIAKHPEAKITFLLSPGSAAMVATMVMLGKTTYHKHCERFIQVYNDKITESVIPFELKLSVIPSLLTPDTETVASFTSETIQDVKGFEDIVAVSDQMQHVIKMAAKAAVYDVNILITGESGVGKEMLAHAIHKASLRKNKKFNAVNCAAFAENLLEDALFGHKKGAYTGADKDKDGIFKDSDKGTLFLDEVGECTLSMQVKLLRTLQPPNDQNQTYRAFIPLGAGTCEEHSDVRIIAATNRDLRKEMADKSFRGDLFFRLGTFIINIPPLRERREDIIPLAEALLAKANENNRQSNPDYKDKFFSDDVKTFIQHRDWPGNIRELSNAISQGIVMADGTEIQIKDLGICEEQASSSSTSIVPANLPDEGVDLQGILDEISRQYFTAAINKAKTQEGRRKLLGFKNYQTFCNWCEKLGISKENTEKS